MLSSEPNLQHFLLLAFLIQRPVPVKGIGADKLLYLRYGKSPLTSANTHVPQFTVSDQSVYGPGTDSQNLSHFLGAQQLWNSITIFFTSRSVLFVQHYC